MQEHLIASRRQPQKYMELKTYPNTNALLFGNTKKPVFIDLCAIDEPNLSNAHVAFQSNAPLGHRYSASNRIVLAGNTKQPRPKVLGKTESQGTSSTSIRTDERQDSIFNQPANNPSTVIEVFDVDGLVNVQSNTCNQSHAQARSKKAIQTLVIQQSRENNNIKSYRNGVIQENRRLFQSLVFQRPQPPTLNEMSSLDEGIQRKKTSQAPIRLEDEVKQLKRRTRNRVRTQGEFFEDPDDIDFYDEEVKKRMKVAKYRYSIAESSRTIDELVPKVTNRIHSSNTVATVQPVPTIPFNSQKHRILIECLKLQFRKRKFVYLQ